MPTYRNALCIRVTRTRRGHPQHSAQDDREEAPLFRTAYARIHNDAAIHASLILSDGKISGARVWLPDGTVRPMERVRIVGNRFQFWFSKADDEPIPEFFDRQVRAFGSELQPLLRRLRIGVVGAGGTGSAVIEQLARLGIGFLLLSDGENFDASNVNRRLWLSRHRPRLAEAQDRSNG